MSVCLIKYLWDFKSVHTFSKNVNAILKRVQLFEPIPASVQSLKTLCYEKSKQNLILKF